MKWNRFTYPNEEKQKYNILDSHLYSTKLNNNALKF